VRPDALIPTCTRKESKKSKLRFNASQLNTSLFLNDCSGKVPFTKAPLLYAPSAAVNVPGGLAASPLATPAPGQENRRFAVHSAYSFRLSGRARSYIHVGRALSARPCASPRPYGNASAIFSRIHAPSSFSAV